MFYVLYNDTCKEFLEIQLDRSVYLPRIHVTAPRPSQHGSHGPGTANKHSKPQIYTASANKVTYRHTIHTSRTYHSHKTRNLCFSYRTNTTFHMYHWEKLSTRIFSKQRTQIKHLSVETTCETICLSTSNYQQSNAE